MRGITKFSIAAAIIGVGSLLIGYLGGPSEAATIDRTRDCDNFAVIRCGTMSASELRAEYDSLNTNKSNGSTTRQSDIPAIFTALGVKRSDLNGDFVKGVVYKDGTVRVNNKVVARDAQTAIRNISGGSSISGSSNARLVSTSRMGTAQEALVKLNSKGQFMFAVMTPCGNPVKARNVVPEPPKPQPKPEAKCVRLQTPVIKNRTNVTLTGEGTASNGATIQSYAFTITNSAGQQVFARTVSTSARNASTSTTINAAGTYTAKVVVNTSIGRQEATACEQKFTIKPEPPKPAAKCTTLDRPVITDRTNVALRGEASATNGATISGYVFTIVDASGTTVASRTVNQTTSPATTNLTVNQPGTYTAKVVVKTSLGDQNGPQCEKKFTIEKPKTPGVSITKKVDGVDHKAVEKDVEFTYQIRVTNSGETDLKDVVVTDEAEEGVTFIRASHGTVSERSWSYTIPELKRGAHMDFTITAKVPEYKAGIIKNTVCVDAPTVPGKPDDCDDATVEVPEPEKIIVCELESKTYPVTINEEDFDSSLHSTDPADCEEAPVPEEPTPTELPKTGVDSFLNILGVGALVTSTVAYAASRRSS